MPTTTNLGIEGTGTFDLAGYNQTVASLGSAGATASTVSDSGAAATLTVNGASNTTFAGVITGPLSLNKAGISTLTLAGANTYSGSTNVTAGTLQLGNGGTTGSLNTSALTDNGTLIFDTSATVSVGYPISGSGDISQIGSGTTILTVANTYTGNTTVSAGTLMDASADAVGTNGILTINGTGTFDLGGFNQTVLNLDNGGALAGEITDSGAAATLTVNNGGAFGGTLTGPLNLTKNGTGTLGLFGNNTYTGGTTINSGTIQLGNATGSGFLYVTEPGANKVVAVTAGGSVSTFLTGFSQPEGIAIDNLGNLYVANKGKGTVSKVALDGTVTTFVSGLSQPEGLALDTLGNLYIASSIGVSKVTPSGAISTTALSGSPYGIATDGRGNVYTSLANTLKITILEPNGQSFNGYAAVSSPTDGLAVDSSGNLAVALRNDNEVSTIVWNGNPNSIHFYRTPFLPGFNAPTDLAFDGSGNLYVTNLGNSEIYKRPPGGPNSVFATGVGGGGFLAVANAGASSGTLGTGPVTDNGTLTFDHSNAFTFSNTITGIGAVTQVGSGTTTFTAANSYTGGTSVIGGTLADGIANALPTSGMLTVKHTGAFDLGGFNQTVGGLADGGVNTGKVTDSGAGATLTVNNQPTNSFSGTISGALFLTKTGAGTLTLSGTNTFTGSTSVNAGTLLVNGTQLGSSVTLNSGSTLGGSGTVGPVTVVGGTVIPGPGSPMAGRLNSGSVDFSTGSGSNYNIALDGTVAGTAYSQLIVTGTVTIDPSTNLNATLGYHPSIGDSYTIINNQGGQSVVGQFLGLSEGATFQVNGNTFQITYQGGSTGNNVVLTCTSAVIAVATTTTLTSSAATPTYGQLLTFTTTVTPQSSSAFTPTGTVTFLNGTSTLGIGTLSTSGGITTATFSTTQLPAGSYTQITAQYSGDGSFSGSTSTAISETVNQAALTITAYDTTKNYGDTVTFAGIEFSTSGLVNGDTVTSVTLASSGADPTAVVAGSPYPITPSAAVGSGLSNYTISYSNGNLTVNPAPLTITANDTTKTYGQAVSFAGTEFTTSGLVNGDTVTSVSLTSPGAATSATVAGLPYDIIPSAAGGSGLGNYTINYVNGSLTVNPAGLTITANSTSKTYGQTVTFAGTEFSTSGLVNGDTVTNVSLNSGGAAATATVIGSPYAIVPSAAVGSGLGNYTISYVNGSLTVNPAALTITANAQTAPTGGTVPALTFNASGLLNGDTLSGALTIPGIGNAGASINVSPGNYPIALGTLANSNYAITFNPANLTVTSTTIGPVSVSQIDDGNVQHSMVRSITLSLANPIASSGIPALLATLSLTRISDGLTVGLTGTLDSTGKVLTLKFSGSSIVGGSLADGRYTLTCNDTTLLDGTQLWRLFGDLYGTGQVNSSDQTAFNLAYGTRKGVTTTNGKAYNQYFDINQTGYVTIDSQTAFNQRLGKKLDANGNLVPC